MDRQTFSALLRTLVTLGYDTGYCHGRIALWKEHGMSQDDYLMWDREHKRIKNNREVLFNKILDDIFPPQE